MRYLPLLAVVFLSSCTLPWSSSVTSESVPHTFSTDYARIVQAMIPENNSGSMMDTLSQWYTKWYPAGYDTSILRFFYSVPEAGSGDLTLGADAVRESWKRMSAKLSLTGSIETPNGSMIFRDIHGEFVSIFPAKTYLKLDALELGGTLLHGADGVLEKVRPNLGKWLLSDSFDIANRSSLIHPSKHDDIAQLVMRVYMNVLQDCLSHGFGSIRKILVAHPILIAESATGKLVGESYEYPVLITGSGVNELVTAFLGQYSGSGGVPESVLADIARGTATISGSGILRVHQTDPDNFGFTGVLLSSEKPYHIRIDSRPERIVYEIMDMSGGITSTLDRLENGKFKYSLQVRDGEKQTEIVRYEGMVSKDIQNATLVLDLGTKTSTGNMDISYTNEKGNFSGMMHIRDVTTDVWARFSGVMEGDRLANFSGNIESNKKTVNLQFGTMADSSFSGSLQAADTTITATWHIRKNDILVRLESQGMVSTLTHQKTDDGNWNGKFEFPIGNITWNGITKNEILEGAHLHLNSPVSRVDVDLEKSGSGVEGPFRISSGGREVLSGSIHMISVPKIASLRIDTTLPGMLLPSYFGFSSFMDIRWSSDAKVVEPIGATSLFDMISPVTPSSLPLSSNIDGGSFPTSFTRSNDALRIAHIKEISTSLGAYYADNGTYPDMIPSGCVTFDDHESNYMSRGIPVDPDHVITPGCNGDTGMTYAYRTFRDSDNVPHIALSAILEDETLWNSVRPISEYTDEDFVNFDRTIQKDTGKYYILTQ